MSRQDREELCALAILDGWGQEWERAAMIASACHNAIMLAAQRIGAEIDADDFTEAEDFRPRRKWESKRRGHRPKFQSVEQGLSRMKGMAGF